MKPSTHGSTSDEAREQRRGFKKNQSREYDYQKSKVLSITKTRVFLHSRAHYSAKPLMKSSVTHLFHFPLRKTKK